VPLSLFTDVHRLLTAVHRFSLSTSWLTYRDIDLKLALLPCDTRTIKIHIFVSLDLRTLTTCGTASPVRSRTIRIELAGSFFACLDHYQLTSAHVYDSPDVKREWYKIYKSKVPYSRSI
jgi:hypothetical protein